MEGGERSGLLFLCVANSTRSQMAEGLARHLTSGKLRIESAGSAPGELNPLAVEAMREIGIDITHHRAKSVESVDLEQIGTVITLCAEEVCPVVPVGVIRHHWPCPDPAAVEGTREEQLAAFRAVRQDILERICQYLRAERRAPTRSGA